ncbi:MAG: hypothetical protein MNPFHGCM_02500 [Gemmatimonadaceae bacterium]|nr:hypothetical protein [Gemmatimonadaceae bacterium]
MQYFVRTPSLALAILVPLACSGEPGRMSDALRQDLSLAAQAQPYMPQPYVSGMELGYDAYGRPVYRAAPYRLPSYPTGPIPVAATRAPAAVRRAPAPAGSGVSSGASGQIEEVRNTRRDAILGAAAGAAIGMASSRDRLKGAVIGAAAGGVLGAIYGQKVDVNKIPR